MSRSTWVVIALAGCGSPARKPVEPGAPSNSDAAAVPAAHYAGLFVDGAEWTYKVTSTSSMNDPADPKADKDGMVKERSSSTVHCKVAEVRRWSGGVLSKIECDASLTPSSDPLAGAWIADARGLYREEDVPAAGVDPDLKDARLVLAATPRPGKDEHKGSGDEEGFGESTEVVQKDGAWCVTYASWGGDEGYETLCFAAGGVVKGAAGWAGGSVHDTTFERVRP
jgi:hypothetical protein